LAFNAELYVFKDHSASWLEPPRVWLRASELRPPPP